MLLKFCGMDWPWCWLPECGSLIDSENDESEDYDEDHCSAGMGCHVIPGSEV